MRDDPGELYLHSEDTSGLSRGCSITTWKLSYLVGGREIKTL